MQFYIHFQNYQLGDSSTRPPIGSLPLDLTGWLIPSPGYLPLCVNLSSKVTEPLTPLVKDWTCKDTDSKLVLKDKDEHTSLQLRIQRAHSSGRFVNQEQWERWRAERKLASGFEIVYSKSCSIWCIFGRKMVHSADHNAFLNTLTMGTPFPCVPAAFQQRERRLHTFSLEMTIGSQTVKYSLYVMSLL